MILFKILWGIDALAAMIILFFFFEGVLDGTVSAYNIGLWMVILLVLAAILFGSIWLRSHHMLLAKGALLALAIPALLYFLFILVAIFGNVRWN